MTSPARSHAEHLIESQIRQRMNYFSPSKNDLDFYQRKVGRLEGDLTQLQGSPSLTQRSSASPDCDSGLLRISKSSTSCLPSRTIACCTRTASSPRN